VLGLQESSCWWPPPPLHCQATGALTRQPRPQTSTPFRPWHAITATPRPAHQEAFKRICRYLPGTLDPWFAYGKATRVLEGYADTDSSMAVHHCTFSGHMPLIDHGDVPWAFKCQETVTPSSFPATSLLLPSHAITSTMDPPCLLPPSTTQWPTPSRRHCRLHSQALRHRSWTMHSVWGGAGYEGGTAVSRKAGGQT
jgi:hypothetical protein